MMRGKTFAGGFTHGEAAGVLARAAPVPTSPAYQASWQPFVWPERQRRYRRGIRRSCGGASPRGPRRAKGRVCQSALLPRRGRVPPSTCLLASGRMRRSRRRRQLRPSRPSPARSGRRHRAHPAAFDERLADFGIDAVFLSWEASPFRRQLPCAVVVRCGVSELPGALEHASARGNLLSSGRRRRPSRPWARMPRSSRLSDGHLDMGAHYRCGRVSPHRPH